MAFIKFGTKSSAEIGSEVDSPGKSILSIGFRRWQQIIRCGFAKKVGVSDGEVVSEDLFNEVLTCAWHSQMKIRDRRANRESSSLKLGFVGLSDHALTK